MRIQGTPPALTLPLSGDVPRIPLRPGTILEARIVAQGDGRITLALADGRRLQARGEVPLPEGASLRLRVDREDGLWLLRRLPDADDPLARALRESLPRARAWSALLPLLRQAPADGPLARLLAALPPLSELLDPIALRRAVARSGLQLERRLARGEAASDDLKRRLLALLEDADIPLRETVEAVLHHLRQRQIEHLQDPAFLALPLPYRDPEGRPRTLELRWRRRQRGGRPVHTLLLSLETARLGPCHAQLRWDGRLWLDLWAERAASLALMEAHGEALEARLREAGLDCARLDWHLGHPPEVDEARPATPLLDLRA